MKQRPPIDEWTPKQVKAVRAAAQRNDTDALTTLGILYRDGLKTARFGEIVPRNMRLARMYIERASRQRDPDALCLLADMLSSQTRSATVSRAINLYRKAHRAGSATAAYNLACLYQRAARYSSSVRWFRIAQAAGDPAAAFQIALAELYGLGVKRNPVSAARKLEVLSREHGDFWPDSIGYNVQSMLVLANALINGWLLPRDFNAGLSWIRKAAKRGSVSARAMLEEYGMTQYVRQ